MSWDPDPKLSSGIEVEKIYHAAVIRDRIWIATTKTEKESQSIRLRWFAPETGTWIDFQSFDAGKPASPAPPRPALWLVSKGDPPLPVVVFRTQSGEIKTFH